MRNEIIRLMPYIVYQHIVNNETIYIGATANVYGFRQFTNRPDWWKQKVDANDGMFHINVIMHSIIEQSVARSVVKAITYYLKNRHPADCDLQYAGSPKKGHTTAVEEKMLIAVDVFDFINMLYPTIKYSKSEFYLDIDTKARNYKFALATNDVKIYEIWSEGFVVTGNASKAQLLGKAHGTTFEKAIDALSVEKNFKVYYETGEPCVWGCRLFDNEHDARLTFG